MMIAPIFGDLLLRQVPRHLIASVQSGEMKVYGSIIRSMTSGQITGHLQETTGLAKLAISALGAPATLPIQGIGLATDIVGHSVSYAQNEQIKAAVDLVRDLQVANLALGAVGIGVCVAGFALLAAKIDRLESRVEAVSEQLSEIRRGIETLHKDRIADDFARLRTVAQQMDEGWALYDPTPQWQHVATEAHTLANLFERRASELLQSPAGLLAAEPFLEALALAATTRVSARMAAGDDVVARNAAEEGARTLIALGQRVHLGRATLARVQSENTAPASREWEDALERAADTLRPAVTAIREREAAAAATIITLAELEKQNIRGRRWLEAARAEHEFPMLCLVPVAS